MEYCYNANTKNIFPKSTYFYFVIKKRLAWARNVQGKSHSFRTACGTGLVLLYAFGTPGCSYEYNNLHAIRVALMIIVRSKRHFDRKTGVGIATGQICTGVIGKPNFRWETRRGVRLGYSIR